jgi:hypothetical protein
MNFLEDTDLKNKLYVWVFIISILISLFTFWRVHAYNVNEAEQVVTVERVTGKYKLLSVSGPSPFKITVKEQANGVIYHNSFVSQDCIKYDTNAIPGMDLTLTRFTNIGIEDNVKSYFFKGAYEQLCTNMKFDATSGDNFFKMNLNNR